MATISAKTSNDKFEISLTVEESSYSTAENTSLVSWSFQIKSLGKGGFGDYGIPRTATINGTNVVNSSAYTSCYNNQTTSWGSGSLTIPHNDDGSKTISISFSATGLGDYSWNGTVSQSGSVQLTTILRASTLTLAASSLTITNATATLGFTATSKGNFYHKLSWKVGSSSASVVSGWNPKQINTTSASGTITTGAILDKMPTSTSGTLTFTLETFTDSAMTTKTGTSTATCSISINTSNIKPSVSLGTISVNTPSSFTNLVAGYSTAKVTVTSTNSRGASSFSTSFTISKGSLSANSTSSTSYTLTTNTLPSGTSNYTFTITATVTDSRGVSASATKESGTVYGYAAPKITSSFYRVAESGSSDADPIGAYVYRAFSATQSYTINGWNNTLTVTAKQNGTSVESGTTDALADTATATLVVTATDKVTTVTKTLTVGTATFPLDLYDDAQGNVGIGLGTTAEGKLVKSALPIRLNQLQSLQSIDSASTPFAIARYNGTNLWLGASTAGAHHHTGGTYISTGYDSTNSKGYDTIMASVPNASNSGASHYGMWHEGNAPIRAYFSEVDWSTGSHSADDAPDGLVWCRALNVTNLPVSAGFGWLMTVGNNLQLFALHSSTGVTGIYYRGYHSSVWDAWNLLSSMDVEAVDYNALSNKPKINSVTLTGNQTSADLNLQDPITDLTDAEIDNIVFGS